MRYLIADVSAGHIEGKIFDGPPAEVGTVEDALTNTLIAELDPAPLQAAEANEVLESGLRCTFNSSPETDPILWASHVGGQGVVKLNGVIVPLKARDPSIEGEEVFAAPGASMTVRHLGEDANWRSNAELCFRPRRGPHGRLPRILALRGVS